jgi:hypothetical protein
VRHGVIQCPVIALSPLFQATSEITDAKLAGDVVVAGTGVSHLIVGLRARLVPRRPVHRDTHDAFQHVADVRTGQAIVTVGLVS